MVETDMNKAPDSKASPGFGYRTLKRMRAYGSLRRKNSNTSTTHSFSSGSPTHSFGTSGGTHSFESYVDSSMTDVDMRPCTPIRKELDGSCRVPASCPPRSKNIGLHEKSMAEQSSQNSQRKGKEDDGMLAAGGSAHTLWVNVRNSTSSIFTWTTLSAPNLSHILLCLSAVIMTQMDTNDCPASPMGETKEIPYFCISGVPGNEDIPCINKILNTVEYVFTKGRLSAECIIIALIYINRVIESIGLRISRYNWQGIVCGAFLLAQKVWDDCSLRTSTFARLFPCFTEENVRSFEIQMLKLLDYNVRVSPKIYAQYYFEFREMFKNFYRKAGNGNMHFPLKPLEMWRAKRLQIRSDSFKLQRADGVKSGVCASAHHMKLGKSIGVEQAAYYDKCRPRGRGRYVHS